MVQIDIFSIFDVSSILGGFAPPDPLKFSLIICTAINDVFSSPCIYATLESPLVINQGDFCLFIHCAYTQYSTWKNCPIILSIIVYNTAIFY